MSEIWGPEQRRALLAGKPPSHGDSIGKVVGSVLAWIFLAGCLVMFLAVVVKLVRWAVA